MELNAENGYVGRCVLFAEDWLILTNVLPKKEKLVVLSGRKRKQTRRKQQVDNECLETLLATPTEGQAWYASHFLVALCPIASSVKYRERHLKWFPMKSLLYLPVFYF